MKLHLQTGVFGGIFISFLMWIAALFLYIPYVLKYHPTQKDPEDLLDSG